MKKIDQKEFSAIVLKYIQKLTDIAEKNEFRVFVGAVISNNDNAITNTLISTTKMTINEGIVASAIISKELVDIGNRT